jgi:hypothetical protein
MGRNHGFLFLFSNLFVKLNGIFNT